MLDTYTTSPLLNPEGAVLTDAGEVDRALTEMWDAGKGKDATQQATRVCLANLILVAHVDRWNELTAALGELSPMYPTRTLAILLDDSVDGSVYAQVTSLCHAPRPGRPQICSEQVVLRTARDSARRLHHTVLALFEPDVPSFVWWMIDPGEARELFDGMRETADRLIVDAGVAGFASVESGRRSVVREIGWPRMYRSRALVAGLFDGTGPDTPERIDQISIELLGDDPADWIDGVWLIAFVGGQLGWQPEACNGPGEWTFKTKFGTANVVMSQTPSPTPGLSRLSIRSMQSTFDIERCMDRPDEYRTIICDQHICEMPRSVQIPRTDCTRAMAVVLRNRPLDKAFSRALPLAKWMISSQPVQ